MIKNCVICGKEFEAIGSINTDSNKCAIERRIMLRSEGYRKRILNPQFYARRREIYHNKKRDPNFMDRRREYHRRWRSIPANKKRERQYSKKYNSKPENQNRAKARAQHRRLDPMVRLRQAAADKRYYLKHRERIIKRSKVYALKNHEQTVQRHRKWVQLNRESYLEKMLKWRTNPKNLEGERARNRRRSYLRSGISPSVQRFFLSMKLGEALKKHQKQNQMKNETRTTAIKPMSAAELVVAFRRDIVENIERFCQLLAVSSDANEKLFDEIVAIEPRLHYNLLASMVKVGTGQLYAELLFDPSMYARKLLPLPVAQQKKLYNEPVKIVKSIAGKNVVEEKTIQKMSRHELTLVIDEEKGRARTVEEQIAFVKPAAPARRAERFEILDGKIKVMAETEFTLAQWREILERAEAKALKTLPQAIKSNQVRA